MKKGRRKKEETCEQKEVRFVEEIAEDRIEEEERREKEKKTPDLTREDTGTHFHTGKISDMWHTDGLKTETQVTYCVDVGLDQNDPIFNRGN